MNCTGPCDQGRRDCPCPEACGIAPPPSSTLIVRVIAVVLAVYAVLMII